MAYPVIETPRGKIIVTKNGKAELTWDTNFKQKWLKRYSAAQEYVDSEVLRLCEPLIPLRTGMLIKSGILGTQVGSGLVQWIAPYAKAQYYMARKKGSQTGPQRGPKWFSRMKEVHGRKILEGARRIAGRGTA